MVQKQKQIFSKRQVPPPQQASSSRPIGSHLASTVAEGFAFGTGSSIARTMVNNVLATSNYNNNNNIDDRKKSDHYSVKCDQYIKLYEECITSTHDTCSTLMDLIHIYCRPTDFSKLD